MPVFFTHNDAKRAQAQFIKDNIDAIAIVKAPLKADTWAQMQAKRIAQLAYTSADVAISESNGLVVQTFNGKSDIDPIDAAADTDDIHFLALDTVNERVLLCTDVTDRVITNEEGDRISFPAIVYTHKEPQAAS